MDSSGTANANSLHFVKFASFGRENFLCGAKWRTMEKEANAFASQAKAMAPEGTQSIVLYDTPEMERFRMAGYASVFRRNSYSLALCTALDQDKRARGIIIFELQDENGERFFWLFCHAFGIIDNDGDTVGTEEFVLDRAVQLQQDSEANSQVKLEITRYGLEESVEYLENVLNRHFASNKKECRFLVIEKDYRKLGVSIAGIVILLGAGYLGYLRWQHIQAERLAAELAAQETARAQAEFEIMRRNAYPHVWQDKPRPSELMPVLLRGFSTLRTYRNGWECQRALWNGKAIHMEYTKRNDLPYSPPPGNFTPSSPFASTLVVNLPDMPDVRGPEELLPFDIAFSTVSKLTLGRPYKHSVKWRPPQSREVPSTTGNIKVRVAADFQTAEIELAGMNFLSEDIAQILNIPGMVLTTVEWAKSGEWKVKGVLYVQKQH